MKTSLKNKQHIALFIDADNAPANKINAILNELANYGMVTIRKAYGNWTKSELKSWASCLHEHAIQPMQQFDITKQKNAADIALVIDCMDTLHTKAIDIICIVSSDCDFTPLATRCAAEGKFVIGFGERKSLMPFVNACSKFLYLDECNDEDENIPVEQTPAQNTPIKTENLKGQSGLIRLLRDAIANNEDDSGWANLANVGFYVSNRGSFDTKNYGYRKLSDLFGAIDLFEVETRETGTYVRDKRKAQANKAA